MVLLVIPIILLGGLIIGWVANIVFKTSYYHGVVLNLVLGVGGALIFGQLFAPIFRRPPMFSGYFSMGTVMVALIGAALLLTIIEIVRRAGMR